MMKGPENKVIGPAVG